MKIVFISAGLGGGGAERVVSQLASEMAERGHTVTVIIMGSNNKTYGVSEKVQVIDCTMNLGAAGISFLRRVFLIRKKVRELSPNVCISFNTTVNLYSALACSYLGRKLILSERNDPICYPAGKFSRALRTLLYKSKYKYVFQTNEAKSFFSKSIQKNGTVIFNPINSEMPDVFEGERTKRIVTAARLEPQKNLKMAIDAFARFNVHYPEYVFEIYGDGSLRNSLFEYVENNGLQNKVILKGASKTLYSDINDASAFVLSSDYEGMSNSMLEAMALGIPTVSTDYPSGGARAVINNGENGFLVPVGDADAMCNALITLVQDSKLANKISKNGVALRDSLSLKAITEKWLEFIEV